MLETLRRVLSLRLALWALLRLAMRGRVAPITGLSVSSHSSECKQAEYRSPFIVDIFAPGQNIASLWYTSDTSTATLSGTSTAAAHIAGLGAYFLALEGPRGAVALCQRLREVATKNALTGIPSGSSNLLAYNLSGL
jgi:subtilisin family serine protease